MKILNMKFDFLKKIFNSTKKTEKYIPKDVKEYVEKRVDLAIKTYNIGINIFQQIKSFFFNLFIVFVRLYHGKINPAINNFILGKKMLEINNLLDAKIRFLLANKFQKRPSAILKYYLAYIYYLEGNMKKCLLYLNESISLKPKMKCAIELFKKIENNSDF